MAKTVQDFINAIRSNPLPKIKGNYLDWTSPDGIPQVTPTGGCALGQAAYVLDTTPGVLETAVSNALYDYHLSINPDSYSGGKGGKIIDMIVDKNDKTDLPLPKIANLVAKELTPEELALELPGSEYWGYDGND